MDNGRAWRAATDVRSGISTPSTLTGTSADRLCPWLPLQEEELLRCFQLLTDVLGQMQTLEQVLVCDCTL